MLPDPRVQAFVDVETGGRFVGLGRSKSYAEAHRFIATDGAEGLPCIAFGRTLRVPVVALWSLAGIDPPRDEAPAPTADATVLTMPLAKKDQADGTPRPAG